MDSSQFKKLGWKHWVGICVCLILIAYLIFKVGTEFLILLGFGSVGAYSYKAKRRLEVAKENAAKAEAAAQRLEKRFNATRGSRAKLDELREILAERESKKAEVNWDENATAPAPDLSLIHI